MRLDPAQVLQQVANLKLLFPNIWDDQDDAAWLLSLASETDLHEVLAVIVDRMRDAASMAGGIAGRIAELEIRQGRFVVREQAMRVLAYKLMTAADLRKAELQEATLSLVNGKPKVIIIDEAALPKECTRTKIEPDKSIIKSYLDAGQEVPGACLSNSDPHLAIRTK